MITKDEVVAKAQARLDQFHPEGADLRVVDDDQAIRQEGDWWYVPVMPSRQPSRITVYYEALAEAEAELMEQDHLSVLFVPLIPEEQVVSA